MGSGCVGRWVGLASYRLIGKGCLTYATVGKGSLTFSALPYLSHMVRMSEMSDMYRYGMVYTNTSLLSVVSVMSELA